MADNYQVNTRSTDGDVFAADEILSVKYPRMKLIIGADGVNDGDVDASNPLPVTGPLTDTELRATAVPVSGTVTASGPLTDTELRATPVPVSGTVTASGPLTDTELRATPVPMSGTVTANLGTIAGVATAANQLPDGHNVTVDNASIAVTAAALPLPSGAATAANQLADGHNVTVDNVGGVEVVQTIAADLNCTEASAAGIKTDTTTIAGDTTSLDGKVTACDTGAVVISSGTVTDITNDIDVVVKDLNGDSCMDEANDALRVNIIAGAGSGGTAMVDDAAFTPGTTNITPTGAMFDDTAPDSVDEGDAGVVRMSGNRNLYTSLRDAAGNERGANVTASNELNVSEANSAAILADTASMDTNLATVAGDTTSIDGKITACDTGAVVVSSGAITETNSAAILADTAAMDTNLATIAGDTTSLDGKIAADTTDDLDTGGGTDTVKMTGIACPASGGHEIINGVEAITASGVYGMIVVPYDGVNGSPMGSTLNPMEVQASTGALKVTGSQLHDAVDENQPISIGGRAHSAEPTAVTAAGDRVNAYFDLEGYQHVKVHPGGTVVVDGSGVTQPVSGTVTETNSGAILADTANMDTNLGTLAGAVSGSEMQVDVVNTPTVNLSTTDRTHLSEIEGAVETIEGAVSGTEMQVDVVAALPAGTNAIGKLAANSGVDIGDVDVTSLPDSIDGPGAPSIDSYTNAAIDVAAVASNHVLVSSSASKQIWVYGVVLTAAADATITFQDEDDTALSGTIAIPANGGFVLPPSGNFAMPWIKLATDKDLEVDTTGAGGTIDGIITYAIVSV